MKKIFLLLILILIIGCGSYTIPLYRPQIKSMLAITETGDTIQVPYKNVLKDRSYDYTRSNYNTSLYWNGWGYNNNYRYNNWWLYPHNSWNSNRIYYNNSVINNSTFIRPKVKPKTLPRRPVIQPRSQHSTPRGSNSNTSNSSTRTRVNIGRSSNGGSRGNNKVNNK